MPLAVVSVAQRARRGATGETGEIAAARFADASRRWLRMGASLLDDDVRGRVAVIISAAREPEVANLIAQTYDLSARAREVAGLVLRGAWTQAIAAALPVTPYTMQDHLK